MFDAGTDAGGVQSCSSGIDLTQVAKYPTRQFYRSAESADLNGDGILDLVAISWAGWPNPLPPTGSTIDVYLGLSDGGLSDPAHYGGTDGLFFTVADFNGDGFPDVAASDWGQVNILLNLGDGRFGSPVPVSPQPLYQDPTGQWTYAVLGAGDINGDGRADLVAIFKYETLLLLNLGGGTFSAPTVLASDPDGNAGGVVVADLNGDGLGDLALTSEHGAVSVFLTQPDGGFEVTRYSLPPANSAFQITTIDRDGRAPDLVFQLFSPEGSDNQGVATLTNTGDGHFTHGGFYPTLNGADSILSGDVNGDCIPDLVTTGYTASVMYGLPDGGFGSPVALEPLGSSSNGIAFLGRPGPPQALVITDFDATVAWGDGGIHVLGNASAK